MFPDIVLDGRCGLVQRHSHLLTAADTTRKETKTLYTHAAEMHIKLIDQDTGLRAQFDKQKEILQTTAVNYRQEK
jgi:formylmethanofuran dehydrogenase subunit E-like metal-binding protein